MADGRTDHGRQRAHRTKSGIFQYFSLKLYLLGISVEAILIYNPKILFHGEMTVNYYYPVCFISYIHAMLATDKHLSRLYLNGYRFDR